jgi:hypothetical protein
LLEDLSFFEDFLHGHAGDNDTSFTFNDTFDNVLDMASLSRDNGGAGFLGVCRRGPVRVATEKQRILLEGFWLVVRADGEDGGQGELQLLDGHGLQVEGKVKGRHRDASDALPWIDKGLFDDPDIVNPGTGDDEVLVRIRNVIPHAGHLKSLAGLGG